MSSKELMLPKHVGIIMDGNRRWANKRGIKPIQGHKVGYDNMERLAIYILNKNIKYLSVYAFSTENFNRSEEEVNYLMDLFAKHFRKYLKSAKENNVKIIFSGRRENLRKDVIDTMDYMTEETKNFKNGTLNICLNYGGQQEVVDAVKKIMSTDIKSEDINEKMFSEYLYQDLPPVDLMIRTSGEIRLSNFLLWQNAYAEFCFPEVCFPDFTKQEFDKILEEYMKRNRRFGGN